MTESYEERATYYLGLTIDNGRGIRKYYGELAAEYKKRGLSYKNAIESLARDIKNDVQDAIDDGKIDCEKNGNWIVNALLCAVLDWKIDYFTLAKEVIGDEEDYNRIDSKNRLPVKRKASKTAIKSKIKSKPSVKKVRR